MNEDYLHHFGVKGMKWGVRRNRTKSKNKSKNSGFKMDKAINNVKNSYSFNAKVNGKKVGNINFRKDPNNEMNIEWMDVKKKHRGKGYATKMMKFAEEFAKSQGATKITAEWVNNSKDMGHILDKFGYKKVSQLTNDDVWGGLTAVEKKLKK